MYLKLRPWIKSHPNVAVYMESDTEVCSNCGSSDIKGKGFYTTNTGRYKTYTCNLCGGISRSRYNEFRKDKKDTLLTSIPK